MSRGGDRGSILDTVDVVRAIESLAARGWFGLEDVANRSMEGGWELLFRKFLLEEFREVFSSTLKRNELHLEKEVKVVPGDKPSKTPSKVADLALLGRGCGQDSPLLIVEIKHNFDNQSGALRSLEFDVGKWSLWDGAHASDGRRCAFQYVQILTSVTHLKSPACRMDGCLSADRGLGRMQACNEFCAELTLRHLKYRPQIEAPKREARIREIQARLEALQKTVDEDLKLVSLVYPTKSTCYFGEPIHYQANIHLFVVTQRARSAI